jgi:hypothetical protein
MPFYKNDFLYRLCMSLNYFLNFLLKFETDIDFFTIKYFFKYMILNNL